VLSANQVCFFSDFFWYLLVINFFFFHCQYTWIENKLW
jgi:hypothetical protein